MKKAYRKIFYALFILTCIFFNSSNLYAQTVIDTKYSKKVLNDIDLDKDDIKAYKKVFALLKSGDFKAAEKKLKKVDNKILLGHFLAEKYLSNSYKSDFSELKAWLKKYSDHPQANRIYNLALKKGDPEDLKMPSKYTPQIERITVYNWPIDDFSKLSATDLKFIETKTKAFRTAIRNGKTKQARLILEDPKVKKFLPKKHYVSLANNLAMKYLTDNYNLQSYNWGQNSVKVSPNATGYWISGVAAWKRKQFQNAANNFKKVSAVSLSDEWMSSAGDFWAARSYRKLNNPKQEEIWLKKAAKYKRTFYGILASSKLGITPDYNWEENFYLNDFSNDKFINNLLSSSSLKRAFALIYVDQEELAEKELQNQYKNMTKPQKEVVLYLARQYNLHGFGIMASNELCDDSQNMSYDHISYPIPAWKPQSGWKQDKALLLALSRQESSFRSYATSIAGACGLMQLMPSTAAYIGKDKNLRKNKDKLFEAGFNLELGQQYVEYLLNKSYIDGNLIYMMTAYNAGPGNLLKWEKLVKTNDPLLFMEVIPSQETRIYLERVMANYWIYQIRLQQDTPTLRQMSKDKWPIINIY